jgi:hypothetical protein
MENNMSLEEFFASVGLSEEEQQEVSQYQFDSESQIDDAIESVKVLDVDETRLKTLYKSKVDELKFKLDSMILKIDKKRDWILFNLKNTVKAAGDAKETKTMLKKSYLSGEIVIKKSAIKLLKPELTEEEVLKDFAEYKKEKTEVTLDWAKLKSELKIIDGKPILAASGKDMSTLISTEVTAESVSVK